MTTAPGGTAGTRPARPAGARRPSRTGALSIPFGARTWREGCHQLLGLPLATVSFTVLVTTLAVGAPLLITFVGLPVLAAGLWALRGLARLERERARLLLGLEVEEPEPLRPRGGRRSPLGWMGAVLRSPVTWRTSAWTLVHLPWSLVGFTVVTVLWGLGWTLLLFPLWFWTVPRFSGEPGVGINLDGRGGGWVWDGPLEVAMAAVLGYLVLYGAGWAVRALCTVDRALVSGLLGPSAQADRVRQLESDRSSVLDTSAADLRRIERDLHDG
ncbi:sensor domain-containing protein, partial [Streptomyces sodiiphilus]|uniref:sensor domain-containing protein n=1 Tax=Streptomyces sodiiphilus TaxID=226217 RepID=UPI0031DAD986